jgi:hypothetical protein
MPGWLRVIRGMIGTGIAFMVGGGAVGLLFGAPLWLSGEIHGLDLLAVAGRFAVVAFPVGVVFSGLLALTTRGRTLEKLSLRRVAALGAGVGLACFALIGINNGFRVWSVAETLTNLAILTVMGGGSAAAILVLARRARPALTAGDVSPALGGAGLEPHATPAGRDPRKPEQAIRR